MGTMGSHRTRNLPKVESADFPKCFCSRRNDALIQRTKNYYKTTIIVLWIKSWNRSLTTTTRWSHGHPENCEWWKWNGTNPESLILPTYVVGPEQCKPKINQSYKSFPNHFPYVSQHYVTKFGMLFKRVDSIVILEPAAVPATA